MRIFQMLCKSRKPQNPYSVPLAVPRLPFCLREKVRGKGAKKDMTQTLQLMQNLITKLSANGYDNRFCVEEAKAMQISFTAAQAKFLEELAENNAPTIKSGMSLNSVQLNKYLKLFPIQRKSNIFEERIQKHSELPAFKQKFVEDDCDEIKK